MEMTSLRNGKRGITRSSSEGGAQAKRSVGLFILRHEKFPPLIRTCQVDVEVITRSQSPHGDSASSKFHGQASSMLRPVGEHAAKLPDAPHQIGAGDDSEPKAVYDGKEHRQVTTEREAGEDEGWASDASAHDRHNSPTSPAADRKKRYKASKQKHPSSSPLGRTGRRHSFRRGILGHAHQLMKESTVPGASDASEISSEVEEEDLDKRGRTLMVSKGGTSPSLSARDVSADRLSTVSLTSSDLRTETSPVRSVHFALDERPSTSNSSRTGSGYNTPRLQGGVGADAFAPHEGYVLNVDDGLHRRICRRPGSNSGSGYSTPRGIVAGDASPSLGERSSLSTDEKSRVTFELPAIIKA